jgi:hypothetical protein
MHNHIMQFGMCEVARLEPCFPPSDRRADIRDTIQRKVNPLGTCACLMKGAAEPVRDRSTGDASRRPLPVMRCSRLSRQDLVRWVSPQGDVSANRRFLL